MSVRAAMSMLATSGAGAGSGSVREAVPADAVTAAVMELANCHHGAITGVLALPHHQVMTGWGGGGRWRAEHGIAVSWQ